MEEKSNEALSLASYNVLKHLKTQYFPARNMQKILISSKEDMIMIKKWQTCHGKRIVMWLTVSNSEIKLKQRCLCFSLIREMSHNLLEELLPNSFAGLKVLLNL